jgi:hypothetical protein
MLLTIWEGLKKSCTVEGVALQICKEPWYEKLSGAHSCRGRNYIKKWNTHEWHLHFESCGWVQKPRGLYKDTKRKVSFWWWRSWFSEASGLGRVTNSVFKRPSSTLSMRSTVAKMGIILPWNKISAIVISNCHYLKS